MSKFTNKFKLFGTMHIHFVPFNCGFFAAQPFFMSNILVCCSIVYYVVICCVVLICYSMRWHCCQCFNFMWRPLFNMDLIYLLLDFISNKMESDTFSIFLLSWQFQTNNWELQIINLFVIFFFFLKKCDELHFDNVGNNSKKGTVPKIDNQWESTYMKLLYQIIC